MANLPLIELIGKHFDKEFQNRIFSPYRLDLPMALKEQAESFVQKLFQLRSNSSYRNHYKSQLSEYGLAEPGNHSILMCYDFHVTDEGQLKLIEVNTNASLLLGSSFLYHQRGLKPAYPFKPDDLKQDILNEYSLFSRAEGEIKRIAIIDDQPSEQAMFPEFSAYQKLFQEWGWKCDVLDYRQLKYDETSQKLSWKQNSYELVYNRYCDFLFEDPSSEDLQRNLLEGKTCLSPHPVEYFYLADKQRIIDWQSEALKANLDNQAQELLEKIQIYLPTSRRLSDWDLNEFWEVRKNHFIKPLRSFGSKQTYKGASISRKHFENLNPDEFITQEYIPAPQIEFEEEDKPFKFDLRFFAYEDKIELAIARSYQGQVTNMRTKNGGLCPISFK